MRIFRYFLAIIPLLFIANLYAQSEKYTLDPSHTYVHWKVNHFGFSSPSGKWLAEGTLWLDEANPDKSKLDVTIKVSNIVTAIPKFDAHLKSADFFDVAKYPTATFKSTKISVNNNAGTVEGDLTLHGVTKPVTLDVKLNKIGVSPLSNKKTAGFTATTTIKRSDFGLGKFTPGVSDDVTVDIEAEAVLAEPKTNADL